ncbi:phosphoribosyl-AMP cyclohydrolase, partial [Xanthomonas citri pv. citri]|nr:phosphoribosyl-AMP cyclohydrolase [Xanthomonas citri pv. citri]
MSISPPDDLVASVTFDDRGLVPAIAQQEGTGEVLMMAWMNAESLRATLETGWAT